jgi:hypothetical protein
VSVDAVVPPILAHRLYEPVPQEVVRQYLESRTAAPKLPATFRGPNWKKDA